MNLNFLLITEFDFLWIRKEGIYKIVYEKTESGPFEIFSSVPQHSVSLLLIPDSLFTAASISSAKFF
jgi:hypothetical protein